MSLIRQVWLLLFATLGLAFVGASVVNVTTARDTLQSELQLKNSDNAASLALALSQQNGERGLMELLIAAQFDTGFYRLIRFTGADGTVAFEHRSAAGPRDAPAWFVALLPIVSAPGTAQVSDGWRALGAIEVVSQTAFAHDTLWRGALRSIGALALIGALAGALGAWWVARLRAPLDRTVAQAEAIEHGDYPRVDEPPAPELRRVTRAMNAMAQRLEAVYQAQAEQLETLQREASIDALTGAATRAHFVARLVSELAAEHGAPACGLILLRLARLEANNRAHGHAATDAALQAVGAALQGVAASHAGAAVGRLNGSDFALLLPFDGQTAEIAAELGRLLRGTLAGFGDDLAVTIGAAETRRGDSVSQAMGAADLALAHAERRGMFSVEIAPAGRPRAAPGFDAQARLRDALRDGRAQLGAFRVVGSSGALLHLDSPLRLQLDPQGGFEVAADWLPLAWRGRMTGDADHCALGLALTLSERDGQARAVNIAPASLLDSGFGARLRALLDAAPRAAHKIWIEVDESAAIDHFALLRELGRQLRPTGVRFGLEHAGERLGRIDRLFDAGLDYVKLDVTVTHAVGADAARAAFVSGITTMLHGLSLQVIAEGVANADDARALWACRVDGLTGPWVEADVR